MPDHPKSAAASIYPNLPHDDGRNAQWVEQQHRRQRNDVASALYPGHRSASAAQRRRSQGDPLKFFDDWADRIRALANK
jgi:hypothetical protein